eukprot:157083_1
MGNVPVIQEVGTSFASLGDVINNDPEKARKRWKNYSKQSVIGSGVMATHYAVHNDMEKAKECGKGMGRATGHALAGGGVFDNVPVFQEVSHAGQSLGHCMAGETKEAQETWSKEYINKSAIALNVQGKHKEAGTAWGSAGITVGVVAACAATGAAAAPLGAAAAVSMGAVAGAAGNVGENFAQAAIKKEDVDIGATIGSGMFGAVAGGVGGYVGAKEAMKYQNAPYGNPTLTERISQSLKPSTPSISTLVEEGVDGTINDEQI